jgi:hypothetical protein
MARDNAVYELTIPARFNGPARSGNGGYSAGLVAAHVEGTASVRLHSPPPLDKPLQVSRVGASVEVRDGDILVATGRPAQLQLDIPPAPALGQARDARAGFPGFTRHLYPTCFVCGPARPDRDGLELFPGPLQDGRTYACPWRPRADFLDEAGNVQPVFVWSALDCPGGYGAFRDHQAPILLGELTLAQYAPVPGGQELVVYAWSLGAEGRKFFGGAAIASSAGDVLAASRSTWIAVKQ